MLNGTLKDTYPANNEALEIPVSKGVVNPSTLLYSEKLSASVPIVVICMKKAGIVVKLNEIQSCKNITCQILHTTNR